MRLPEEIRFEGTEVVVRREGVRVVLEPVKANRKLRTREEIREMFRRMDAIGGEPLRVEDRNQPAMPEPKDIFRS